MIPDSSTQRVARLTPLGVVLTLIDQRVAPAMPHRYALAAARGCTLAENVATLELPPQPIALRDGYAVEAASIADAGPYAPVALPAPPVRIEAGAPLPKGADAVAPIDAIQMRGDRAEAIAAVSPGESVLAAGGDATPRAPLRRAGERLRPIDVAVLAAAGIENVTVRRPRIRIARGGAAPSPSTDAALDFLIHAISSAGGSVLDSRDEVKRLDEALGGLGGLGDAGPDAIIAVGGTGEGMQDRAVRTLSELGTVAAHGIALSPGETAALGFVGSRPVLLFPGRLDAVLANWLLIGRHLLAKLAGGGVDDRAITLPLKRKATSTIGLAELIPVRCADGMAEPLGASYLSLEALARSDGWIVVPPEREGFAAATPVAVRSWP
jgi:molybdopterin molybdotransferase